MCCAVLGLALLGAPAASADEAEAIYDPGAVFFIDLTLDSAAKANLEAKSDEYVKGFFSLTKSSDGTPAGEEPTPFIAPRPVEVRLKGSEGGSFRELTEKAAFKLKFKKADAVLGLRKMTLNNMVQDPSMVHETLAYAAFGAAGVPASRTGFAYLRLNDEDFGLYLDLENLDDIALAKLFGSFDDEAQHLYEGERGDDVFPGGAALFEIDEGPDDRSDLEALVDAASGGGAPFSTRVAAHANLAEMTRMWAVEKYIDHWDGYSGHAEQAQTEAGLRPNNYYLYSELSGRFQMLPWGTDQAWIPTIGVGTPGREVTFDGSGGVLFNRCLEDEKCFRAYWEALRDTTDAIATLDPAALAEDTASMLVPWQEEEVLGSTREEHDIGDIEEGVETSLDFIAGRRAEAEEWLDENEPPPIVTVDSPVVSQGQAQSPKTGVPVALFAHSGRSGRYLTARLQLSTAATIALRASLKTPQGRKRVCAASKAAAGAGEWPINCRLSGAAMAKLARGPLRLKLAFTVTPAGGSPEAIVRSIRLARS